MSGDLSDLRTNSILIATGVLLVVLDLGTAYLIEARAAFLGAIGVYLFNQVIALVDERRVLSQREKK